MKSDLERAAEILDEIATALFEGASVNGEWIEDEDECRLERRDHDEYRALANRLRKMQT